MIEKYQCPGCAVDCDGSRKSKADWGQGCGRHDPGTFVIGLGKMFLGMPEGFNRLGPFNDMPLTILDEPFVEDRFNRVAWKCLDEHGNTIIRGLMPRINRPFLIVTPGDHRDLYPTAIDMTDANDVD